MDEKLEKQLKLLEFIRSTLSNIEGEEYKIRRIILYHPNYTIFGDTFHIGNVLLICNEAYNEALNYGRLRNYGVWSTNNYPYWEAGIDNHVLSAQTRPIYMDKGDGNMKTIMIKYDYGFTNYFFKKVLHGGLVKKQYPYIIESLSYLMGYRIDNVDIDQLISDLSKNIGNNSKVKEKSLFKK